MKTIEEMSEEELNAQLRTVEEERADFEQNIEKLKASMEEEEFKAGRRYQRLDDMRGQVSSQDYRILGLIDYNQSLLNSMNKRNAEKAEYVKEMCKKKQVEWDMKEEDIYVQMNKLQEDKEENQEEERWMQGQN